MKKLKLNIEDLFNIPTSVIYSPDELRPVYNVTIDSRKVKKNSLFFAIKGKRFDGHDFVADAVKNGAAAVVINRRKLYKYDNIDVPVISVRDTLLALGESARLWRRKLNARVVAITGSSGKTTVKEMLAGLLAEKFEVSKTEANNNNNIGVPLTIFNTNEKHQVLVAELGTNHFGEIPYLAKIISPDYALITNIGNSHLQFLKNKQGVWKEKVSLFDETIKNHGTVFINNDDPIISSYKVKRSNRVSYGFFSRADVRGKITNYTSYGTPVIELSKGNEKIIAELPVYGENNAADFLAAASVALELGISKRELLRGIKKLKSYPGRMNVIRFKDFILIDDSYNANPDSTRAAIEQMSRINIYKRKILLLGDMLELGSKEIFLHRSLAETIRKSGIDFLFTIGKRMKHLHNLMVDEDITAIHFNNRKSLSLKISKMDFSSSVILVKGSRGMHMEEFLEQIKLKAGC